MVPTYSTSTQATRRIDHTKKKYCKYTRKNVRNNALLVLQTVKTASLPQKYTSAATTVVYVPGIWYSKRQAEVVLVLERRAL